MHVVARTSEPTHCKLRPNVMVQGGRVGTTRTHASGFLLVAIASNERRGALVAVILKLDPCDESMPLEHGSPVATERLALGRKGCQGSVCDTAIFEDRVDTPSVIKKSRRWDSRMVLPPHYKNCDSSSPGQVGSSLGFERH